MRTEESNELIYSDLRILDLSGQMGVYCGKLLADLGAEVIKIEPPCGDPMRHIGPFVDDDPDPEKSLYWFQFNTSKKSITLDITTADGKSIFRQLAATADMIIESFPPGYMDSLGLGYEDLSQENPGLIMTFITPFGQTGPYRDYKASDLVGQAMGGQMFLAGFPEGPPVRTGGSQAYYQASFHAVVATLIALEFRDITGQGQHVDVSMQEAVCLSMEVAMQFWDLNKVIRTRIGSEHRAAAQGVYPCKDGHVVIMTATGGWPALVDWMNEEGYGLELAETRNSERMYRMENRDLLDAMIMPWLLDHTVSELHLGGQSRHIIVMPVNSPKDLVECPHLNARGFFVDVAHPELGASYKYTGAPYRFEHITWRIAQRAPLIGEHNHEIYRELGLSRQDLVALTSAGII